MKLTIKTSILRSFVISESEKTNTDVIKNKTNHATRKKPIDIIISMETN